MWCVIVMIKHREDNTGDPEVDFEIEYDVFGPFESGDAAQQWVESRPFDQMTWSHILKMTAVGDEPS